MPSVVCVLGCRVGSQALARRAQAGRDVFFARNAALIVACGGRKWAGRVEADVIAALLVEKGVPKDAIVRERCSLDTRDNACFAASMLERRSFRDVILVSCSWHLPRAARLFENPGFSVANVAKAMVPGGGGQQSQIQSIENTFLVTPEPATLLTLLPAAAILVTLRRRMV